MSKYKELLQKRHELELQIAQARHSELAEVIQKVRSLVAEFDLKASDVFPTAASKPRKMPSGKIAPKFKNPVTGDTWTGRGKTPLWIKGKDKSAFLIT